MDSQCAPRFCGLELTDADLTTTREVVAEYPGLSRMELAGTVCEVLGWLRPSGSPKIRECSEWLEGLEAQGLIVLPGLRSGRGKGSLTSTPVTSLGEPGRSLEGTVRDLAPILIERVVEKPDRRLWRELVGRYHYLGCKVPFGARLRYLVWASRPERVVVGCVQISSPAWRMAARDQWIGWDDETRGRNLQRIVSNSRFLILPWVRVRNLASTVLSRIARQVSSDWQETYGVEPLLLETLVDGERFEGTCYRAAGWTFLGQTSGRGRMDREHRLENASPKKVFVLPLVEDAPRRLSAAWDPASTGTGTEGACGLASSRTGR
jgi:hypothetical protein